MSNILVVDDEKTILMIIKEFLEDEKFKVITADNGFDAISLLKINEIDIALIDLNLPKMNGSDLIKAIREDNKLKHIPIIIMSGAIYNSKFFPLDEMYQEFLQKPFEFKELLEKVNKYI